MHEKLKHLSESQHDEMLKMYYDPERKRTVSEIIKLFDIDTRPGDLSSLFPKIIHDEVCIYCVDSNLESKAASRTSNGIQNKVCPQCKHSDEIYCKCQNCRETEASERKARDNTKREIIYEQFDNSECLPPNANTLDLTSAIFLRSVIDHRSSEDFNYVFPFTSTERQLAPTYQFKNEIVKTLFRQNLIGVCPESKFDGFVFEDYDGTSMSYYPTKVDWLLLPHLNTPERLEYIHNLSLQLDSLMKSSDNTDDELLIWHLIVKNEALEYYELKLSEINIQLDKMGEKTHSTFENLSERFSLAQIYQLIFTTIRNTNHYCIQQNIPKYQVKNMFIGALKRNADKYETEGWLKDYRRDFNCPQSTVSSVYFNSYLKVGEDYFKTSLPI